MDETVSYHFATVKQRRENRHEIDYQLTLRQQPKQSRMCGVGEKADRRPIDPPPIVQLKVFDSKLPMAEKNYLQNPYYFMYASLMAADLDEELHLLRDGKTRSTTGSVVSSLYHLKDIDNTDAGFFVFPDLSVRMEGSYRLKLSLFEIIGKEVFHCRSIISNKFFVYSAKKFPGMEESTFLSRSFADQGLKIRIRKELRQRRKLSKISDTEEQQNSNNNNENNNHNNTFTSSSSTTSTKKATSGGPGGKRARIIQNEGSSNQSSSYVAYGSSRQSSWTPPIIEHNNNNNRYYPQEESSCSSGAVISTERQSYYMNNEAPQHIYQDNNNTHNNNNSSNNNSSSNSNSSRYSPHHHHQHHPHQQQQEIPIQTTNTTTTTSTATPSPNLVNPYSSYRPNQISYFYQQQPPYSSQPTSSPPSALPSHQLPTHQHQLPSHHQLPPPPPPHY